MASKNKAGTTRRTAGKKSSSAKAPGTRKSGGTQKTAPKRKPAATARPGLVGKQKRAGRTGKQKTPQLAHELKKILIGIMALSAICLTTAMVLDIVFNTGPGAPPKQIKQTVKTVKPLVPDPPPKEPEPVKQPVAPPIEELETKTKLAGLKEKTGKEFVYEIFEKVEPSRKTPPKRPETVLPPDHSPKICLIIDDIGYDIDLAYALFNLEPGITFSVLPGAPYGRAIAEDLNRKGAQIMLHLPMEPVEYPKIDPGPDALLVSMNPDQLISKLTQNINQIPMAVGVNNHMGSRLTTREDQMNQIFTILKKKNLFFVDSLTSGRSKCLASARLLQLPFAHRDVFLDNFQNVTYIAKQLNRLVDLAEKHGTALGIGHPYKATLQALEQELPRLRKKVDIVPASTMAQIPG